MFPGVKENQGASEPQPQAKYHGTWFPFQMQYRFPSSGNQQLMPNCLMLVLADVLSPACSASHCAILVLFPHQKTSQSWLQQTGLTNTSPPNPGVLQEPVLSHPPNLENHQGTAETQGHRGATTGYKLSSPSSSPPEIRTRTRWFKTGHTGQDLHTSKSGQWHDWWAGVLPAVLFHWWQATYQIRCQTADTAIEPDASISPYPLRGPSHIRGNEWVMKIT